MGPLPRSACVCFVLLTSDSAKLTVCEKNLATSDDNLSKERSQGSLLRQRFSTLSAEVDTLKASQANALETAAASNVQVAELSGKLGAATEQVCAALLWRTIIELGSPSSCFVAGVVV